MIDVPSTRFCETRISSLIIWASIFFLHLQHQRNSSQEQNKMKTKKKIIFIIVQGTMTQFENYSLTFSSSNRLLRLLMAKGKKVYDFHVPHNAMDFPHKISHKLCFQFLLPSLQSSLEEIQNDWQNFMGKTVCIIRNVKVADMIIHPCSSFVSRYSL